MSAYSPDIYFNRKCEKLMEKELLMHSPAVSGYPIHANLNSILPNHPSYKEWLFTNHMQLRLDWYETNIFHLDFYQPLMREYHPLLNIHSIQKEMLRLLKMDICDFFVESINNGSYIYVLIDKKYIPAYKTDESSPHDLFIYGYDAKTRDFKVADFFPEPFAVYKKTTATFHQIKQAVQENINYKEDTWDNIFGIQLISINKWKSYTFNLVYFKNSIEDYRNSTNSAKRYEIIEGIPAEEQCLHGSLHPVFGMSVYNRLIEIAGLNFPDLSFQFLRAMHMLYEHKALMTKRIRYLRDLGLLEGKLFEEYFKDVEQKAHVIRNYILKHIITQGTAFNKNKLVSMIDELSYTEYNYLGKLSDILN